MTKKFLIFLCLLSIFLIFACDNSGTNDGTNGCGTVPPDGNGGVDDTDTCYDCECGPDSREVAVTTRSSGEYGSIDFMTQPSIGITSLKTTLTVPKKASGSTSRGTLFIWPGLMPGRGTGMNRGVLQPVLTWGASCASRTVPAETWWIAGMYVTGMGVCYSGDNMTVDIGDKLDIEMTLNGTMWRQVVTNRSNGKTVSYDIDMNGVPQYWALFAIEVWDQAVRPVEDIVFTDTVLTFARSAPGACMPSDIGPTDWLTSPRISNDGKTCCISKMILRAKGVPATSPNAP